MELGAHVNYVSLKPRHATGRSIDIVELTPRSATTAKVRTAIQLIPATNVKPPPGNFNDNMKPPGNFNDNMKPPGNFDDPTKPPGNFDEPHINHGVALAISRSTPTNHGVEEEEQTIKSVPGVNTWWSASDIKEYLNTEKPGAILWYPWNAYIFDSVTDFVSSLRAEASMPGAHFK